MKTTFDLEDVQLVFDTHRPESVVVHTRLHEPYLLSIGDLCKLLDEVATKRWQNQKKLQAMIELGRRKKPKK